MTNPLLIGSKLIVIISDPWDFVSNNGTGPFYASLLNIGADYGNPQLEAMLIQLDQPTEYAGERCEFLIATPRHQPGTFNLLLKDTEILCALTRVNESQALSANPFDLSWWRGGLGLIGSIKWLQ